MKVSQFLLLVATLTGAASNLIFKKHVHESTAKNWSVARDYCRQNHVDLSIIDTQQEYNRFTSQIAANAGVRSWIGLSKNRGETEYTKWCNGTPLSFRIWDSGQAFDINNQHCITTENNKWCDYYCDRPMPFFCYSEVIVIEEKKTWDEAQKHCRTYYTDLFSVTTQTDLLVVNDIRLNITSSFWTGLRFLAGSWFWVNEEEFVGSQVSLPSCPNRPFFCGARKAGANTCENRDCREKMYFACYRQGSE